MSASRVRRPTAVGVGDTDDDQLGNQAVPGQEAHRAGGVQQMGVAVGEVEHGVALLAGAVALGCGDQDLTILCQNLGGQGQAFGERHRLGRLGRHRRNQRKEEQAQNQTRPDLFVLHGFSLDKIGLGCDRLIRPIRGERLQVEVHSDTLYVVPAGARIAVAARRLSAPIADSITEKMRHGEKNSSLHRIRTRACRVPALPPAALPMLRSDTAGGNSPI